MKKAEINEIITIMNVDPLAVAEEFTKESYKTSKNTSMWGMSLQLKKNEILQNLFEKVNDVYYGMPVDKYLEVLTSNNFEIVLHDEFQTKDHPLEHYYILFNYNLGILISFDTYSHGTDVHVNGGSMYYNWSPNNLETKNCISSGCYFVLGEDREFGLFESDLITPYEIPDYPKSIKWADGMLYEDFKKISAPVNEKRKKLLNLALDEGKRLLWIGNHGCREGVITQITHMQNNGVFFPQWHEAPFLFLSHWGEREENYEELNDKKIVRLPEQVRKQIGL